MSNSKTSNGIIIPNLDTESRNTGQENTLLRKKKLRNPTLKINEREYEPQAIQLGNSISNKAEKDNGLVITLTLNEDSPLGAVENLKNKKNPKSDHKKLSTDHKINMTNSQINHTINSHNPYLMNKNLNELSNDNLSNNLVRIKNPDFENTDFNMNNISNNSSDPNYLKKIQQKINFKSSKILPQQQSNITNQATNLSQYINNGNDIVSSSSQNQNNNLNNTVNFNNLINQSNFISNNKQNNNFLTQQQMQILNQFNNNLNNINNPMQMMNKIAMNMQNQNLNYGNQSNLNLKMNNPQQNFISNNNLNLINTNNNMQIQNLNKVNFPNPGVIQPSVNNQNKNLSFSSNFLHLLNKNYIECKQSSLAHVKILNPVYRNSIIPVVPELFSKSSK